jgi:heme exporter protein B
VGSIAAIIRKDLTLELRGAGSTLSLVVFSILVLTVLVVAFGPSPSSAAAAETAAGTLWVALIFSGVLGASRTISAEREGGSIYALLLSPIDTGTIFLAKLVVTFIFIAVAETASMCLIVLFFNLDPSAVLFRVAPILLLGAFGFSAISTLLASISTRTRVGELILPLLVIPVFVPALIGGVKATAVILSGAPFADAAVWLRIITAFDILYAVAGYLLFDYVVGE